MTTSIPSLAREFLAECRARKLSRETLRWYDHKLARFLDYAGEVGLSSIDPPAVHAYIQTLSGIKPYTVRGYVQVLKFFLTWAAEEGEVDPKVLKRVKLPKVDKRLIRPFGREHFDLLLDATKQDGPEAWFPARDAAILWVLLTTGIRVTELCTLQRKAVRDDWIAVIGKGNKEREVGPLPPDTQRAIRRYLRACPFEHRALFLTRYRAPFTGSGVDQLIYRLRDWAGPERFGGVRVSAHTFRHTFATQYMRAGGDIKRLSLLLGHTSVSTTERYLGSFSSRDVRSTEVVSVFDRNWGY